MASGVIKMMPQIDNGVTKNPTAVAANSTATWNVTFNKAFSKVPSVCINAYTGSPLSRNATVYNVTTTGFIVYFTNNSTAINANGILFNWIAVAS